MPKADKESWTPRLLLLAFVVLLGLAWWTTLPFLPPILVRGKMTMHPLVAFVAMFGGVIVFGLIGLLVGPLILSGLITVLRIYQRDLGPHADNDEADQPVPEQKPAGALPEVERLKH